MLQCNCHIVGDPKTRDALVIDPGDDAERILEVIHRTNCMFPPSSSRTRHIDHVGGLAPHPGGDRRAGSNARRRSGALSHAGRPGRMDRLEAAGKVEVNEFLREGDASAGDASKRRSCTRRVIRRAASVSMCPPICRTPEPPPSPRNPLKANLADSSPGTLCSQEASAARTFGRIIRIDHAFPEGKVLELPTTQSSIPATVPLQQSATKENQTRSWQEVIPIRM